MKNHRIVSVILISIMMLAVSMTGASHAGWVLYDNFDSGEINPEKWYVEGSSANVSIRNGKARFDHQQGHPGGNTYLRFAFPAAEDIKGVRVNIKVVKAVGDLRGRIITVAGKLHENYIYTQFNVGPADQALFYWVHENDSNTEYLGDLFHGEFLGFASAQDLIGKTFRLSIDHSNPKQILFSAPGARKSIFRPPQNLTASDWFARGIGTRSNSGEGHGTVLFDNVYVLY